MTKDIKQRIDKLLNGWLVYDKTNSKRKFTGKDISIYMIASFCYYKLDVSIMEDSDYDLLCKGLLEYWDKISHPHKNLISVDDLSCGSGYAIQDYPKIVKMAARHYISEKDVNPDLLAKEYSFLLTTD